MTKEITKEVKEKIMEADAVLHELHQMGEQIQGDIWGDLRWIRHSIAHRDAKGIEELKKARLITDFAPGQEIILVPPIMEQIRQELENWYTEFLIKYFSPGRKTKKIGGFHLRPSL